MNPLARVERKGREESPSGVLAGLQAFNFRSDHKNKVSVSTWNFPLFLLLYFIAARILRLGFPKPLSPLISPLH